VQAGIKSSFVRTDNNAVYTLYDETLKTWEPDTSVSNHFIYKENINAAYVDWHQQMGKFAKTNDKNTFGISYGIRIERPSYQSLNPFRFEDELLTFKEHGDSNYTIIQTSGNLASQRNIGLGVNYSKQLMRSWTFNASVNVYNNRYRGVVDSTPGATKRKRRRRRAKPGRRPQRSAISRAAIPQRQRCNHPCRHPPTATTLQ
jgi:hypothetical protein